MENIEKIASICKVLSDNKAEDIKIVDCSKSSNIVNFFIIATASSVTHVKSLIDFCQEEILNNELFNINFRELYNTSKWQVLDFSEGFVHVFTKEERDKYSLEKLLSEKGDILTYEKLLKKNLKQEKSSKKEEKKKINSRKLDTKNKAKGHLSKLKRIKK